MSYYKGDFYQGDFYQGDPGFFSFLGKVAKGALGVASSFMPGGAALGKVASVVSKIPGGTRALGAARAGAAIAVRHPVLSAAGAAGVVGAGGAYMGRRGGRMGAAGVGPAIGGRMGAGGMGRRHRRMHVTNVKALRRAIRRAKGFEKLARRVMHFTSPRPPKGRAIFKVRRKKRI